MKMMKKCDGKIECKYTRVLFRDNQKKISIISMELFQYTTAMFSAGNTSNGQIILQLYGIDVLHLKYSKILIMLRQCPQYCVNSNAVRRLSLMLDLVTKEAM